MKYDTAFTYDARSKAKLDYIRYACARATVGDALLHALQQAHAIMQTAYNHKQPARILSLRGDQQLLTEDLSRKAYANAHAVSGEAMPIELDVSWKRLEEDLAACAALPGKIKPIDYAIELVYLLANNIDHKAASSYVFVARSHDNGWKVPTDFDNTPRGKFTRAKNRAKNAVHSLVARKGSPKP